MLLWIAPLPGKFSGFLAVSASRDDLHPARRGEHQIPDLEVASLLLEMANDHIIYLVSKVANLEE